MIRLLICGIALPMALLAAALTVGQNDSTRRVAEGSTIPPDQAVSPSLAEAGGQASSAGAYPTTSAAQREFHRQFALQPLGTVQRVSPYATVTNLGGGAFRAEFSALPATRSDGRPIDPRWIHQGGRFVAGINLFAAVVDGNTLTVTALTDQAPGAGPGDTATCRPRVFVAGVEYPPLGQPHLLTVDPTNPRYQNNTLEWDHGICQRRVRLIQGTILESYIFNENPKGDVVVDSNRQGTIWPAGSHAVDANNLPLAAFEITGDEKRASEETLAQATYPLIVADETTFLTSASDGTLWGCGAYSTARTASSATYVRTTSSALYIGLCCNYWGDCLTCGIERSFVFFNTSSLGSSATIYDAVLSLYGNGKSIGSFQNFYLRIQNGQPTYPHDPLEAADYSYTLYSGNGGQISANTLAVAEYHDIPLTELAWVNKTGTTKLALRSSRDIDNGGEAYSSSVYVYSHEAGTGYEPKLTVTYVPFPDCNYNGIPDECDIDCGTSGGPCDVQSCGMSEDCNTNSLPDECDIAAGTSQDCNSNGTPDQCDIAAGTSWDCNFNGIPDECDDTIQILRPNGFGSECSIPGQSGCSACNNHYTCVDEATPDDAGSYVYFPGGTSTWRRDLYSLPGAAASGNVNSVTVYMRTRHNNSNAKTSLRTHATTYDGIAQGSSVWQTWGQEWTVNPYTSAPWTWDEIEALEVGVALYDGSAVNYPDWADCTQVYAAVSSSPAPCDCNSNGVPDVCDISCGTTGGPCDVPGCGTGCDCNANGVLDECEVIDGGDFDADGGVDLSDYEAFAECMAGADQTPAPPAPECVQACLDAFDFDEDEDVDLDDFAGFQTVFNGGP